MFGEYCLWCDEKVVALICNERFFLKPTLVSDGLGLEETEAYPGSKSYRVVPSRIIDDSDGFRSLVKATADALPPPKPKSPRKRPLL